MSCRALRLRRNYFQEMEQLSAPQLKAILTLKLQKAGLRPSAAEIKSREVMLMQGDRLLRVRSR